VIRFLFDELGLDGWDVVKFFAALGALLLWGCWSWGAF